MGIVSFFAYAQTDAGRDTQVGDWVTSHFAFLPTSTPGWMMTMIDQPTTIKAERDAGKQVYLPAYLPRGMSLASIARMVPDRWNGPPQSHELRLAFLGAATPDQTNLNQFAIFQEELPTYLQTIDFSASFDPRAVISKTVIQGYPAVYVKPQHDGSVDDKPKFSTHTFYFRIGNHRFIMFGDIGFEQMVKVAASLSPTLAEVQHGTGDILPTPGR